MLFSSITFLFAFLPVVLLVYFISPVKLRNFILVFFSLLFYAWGEPRYVLIMLLALIIGYIFGIVIEYYIQRNMKKRAQIFTIVSITLNLGLLVYFKYAGFFVNNLNMIPGINIEPIKLTLPLGISFYTFQILSYTIDVYRKTARAKKNPIDLAAYITFFPQLIAGPIVRYETIEKELCDRRENVDDFAEGARRVIAGLGKKVLIANTAGALFDQLKALGAGENTVLLSWLCSIAFSIQIYFDFSGYSDMAIGMGRMFGFHFPENFNYPYISRSITEFWRRWHISLSTWFRDYVYIPLGGNQRGRVRTVFNMLVVWLLTGFWHGAAWNFIIWGFYYFVLLSIEKNVPGKVLDRLPDFVRRLYTLFFVNIGWVIFAYDNTTELTGALKNMFGFGNIPLTSYNTGFYFLSYGMFICIAVFASTPVPKYIGKNITDRIKNESVRGIVEALILSLIFIMSVAFLAGNAYNPFIYSRF